MFCRSGEESEGGTEKRVARSRKELLRTIDAQINEPPKRKKGQQSDRELVKEKASNSLRSTRENTYSLGSLGTLRGS